MTSQAGARASKTTGQVDGSGTTMSAMEWNKPFSTGWNIELHDHVGTASVWCYLIGHENASRWRAHTDSSNPEVSFSNGAAASTNFKPITVSVGYVNGDSQPFAYQGSATVRIDLHEGNNTSGTLLDQVTLHITPAGSFSSAWNGSYSLFHDADLPNSPTIHMYGNQGFPPSPRPGADSVPGIEVDWTVNYINYTGASSTISYRGDGGTGPELFTISIPSDASGSVTQTVSLPSGVGSAPLVSPDYVAPQIADYGIFPYSWPEAQLTPNHEEVSGVIIGTPPETEMIDVRVNVTAGTSGAVSVTGDFPGVTASVYMTVDGSGGLATFQHDFEVEVPVGYSSLPTWAASPGQARILYQPGSLSLDRVNQFDIYVDDDGQSTEPVLDSSTTGSEGEVVSNQYTASVGGQNYAWSSDSSGFSPSATASGNAPQTNQTSGTGNVTSSQAYDGFDANVGDFVPSELDGLGVPYTTESIDALEEEAIDVAASLATWSDAWAVATGEDGASLGKASTWTVPVELGPGAGLT